MLMVFVCEKQEIRFRRVRGSEVSQAIVLVYVELKRGNIPGIESCIIHKPFLKQIVFTVLTLNVLWFKKTTHYIPLKEKQ